MAFWFAFFFWLGSNIVSALLTKPRIEGARPSGLDDFRVPTATEGRAVPVIVGKVRMAGPNVVWYGDLTTRAIREKVGGFLGIGGKNVTKAYQYFLGVQMAISRGEIDGIDRIWLGDKVIKSGETTGDHSTVILDDEFFGGEDRGGGIDFTLDFKMGSRSQAVQSYLATQQTPTPAYRSTCYCVLYDGSGGPGYIGNAAQLRNMAFEPFWYPNSLAVTGGKERIGDDANPICFLYEILVNNDDWGLQISGADVLLAGTAAEGALRALAEQVADEGLGFSMVLDREIEARDLIQEIERHADGAFRLDLTDGKFKIVLARPPAGSVPTLDESNIIEMRNFARSNWADTKNELRVSYADRAKDYSATFAFDYDNANRDIVGGRRNITSLNFPGIKTAAVANRIVARELVGFSFPLAKMQALVSRSMYTLQKGDAFNWTWPDYGITTLAMRVIKVTYDDDKSGEILIDAVEDVFRLQTAGFVDPPPSGFVPPSFDPVSALDARLWEPPQQLYPVNEAGTRLRNVVALVARNGGLQLSYNIFTDLNGGTDAFELTNEAIDSWTPAALLMGALDKDLGDVNPYFGDVTIDNLNDVDAGILTDAASTTIDTDEPLNTMLIDDEVLWFEGVTDNLDGSVTLTNVHRGAFGTNPADHADNARVWFPGFGAATVAPVEEGLAIGVTTIRCRIQTITGTGTLAIASAPNVPLSADYSVTGLSPYAPAAPVLNTRRLFVDEDWTASPGAVRLAWNNRNRNTQPFDTKQDTTGINSLGTVGATASVRRVDTDAVVASATFANSGEFNATGFIPVTTPGPVLGQDGSGGTPGVLAELDYYIELDNRSSGLQNSQQWRSQNFEAFGFGLDLGGNFGGQELSSDANNGIVQGQASAPLIVDPVPSVPGETRRFTIDVAGMVASQSQSNSTGLRLLFTALDNQANEFVNFDFYIDALAGKTLADMATEIEDEIRTSLADRPFTVSRSDTQVVVLTNAGDLSLRVTNLQSAQQHGALSVVQDALATQPPTLQTAYIDYFERIGEFDELAPANDAAYQNSGTINVQFNLIGLTEAARQRLEDEGINGGSTNVFASAVTVNDRYDFEFANIVDRLNAHGNSFAFNASAGVVTGLTFPMSRRGIVISCQEDFTVQSQFVETNTRGQPSGFALLIKEGTNARPRGPLPQVSRVFFLHNTIIDHEDVVLSVTLAGTVFSRTVAALGGSSTGARIKEAISLLRDDIDADGAYTATLIEGSSRDELRIEGGSNVTFEALFATGYGPRIEFRRTVE